MKNGIMSKMKFFIIATLVLIVAGMAMIGFLGFNQNVDHGVGYSVEVSIDRKAEGATDVLKSATEKFFADNDIVCVKGSTIVLDDGMGLSFKFNKDVSKDVEGLKAFIEQKLADGDIKSVEASVVVNEHTADLPLVNINMLIVVLVVIAVIFLYALILEKLSGALATIFAAVLAGVLFTSLMAITRLPASPFVVVCGLISIAFAGALSVSSVGRFKEESKNSANEKSSPKEIVDSVAKIEGKKYLLALIVVALAAIALAVTMSSYFMLAGAQLIIAGLTAIFSAMFGAPFIWTAVKSRKN